jgi:hypothetical protein
MGGSSRVRGQEAKKAGFTPTGYATLRATVHFVFAVVIGTYLPLLCEHLYLAVVTETFLYVLPRNRCLCHNLGDVFNKPLLSNGFTCHIAPSLRFFFPNSLTVYQLYFLTRAVLATSVIDLAFLPMARISLLAVFILPPLPLLPP